MRLVQQLTIAQLGFSLLLASATGLFLYRRLSASVGQGFQERVAGFSRDLADALSIHVAGSDAAGIPLSPPVQNLFSQDDTAFLLVFDGQGEKLFEGLGPAGTPALLPSRPPAEDEPATRMVGDVLRVTLPIEGEVAVAADEAALDFSVLAPGTGPSERIGTVVIGYGLGGLITAQERALRDSLLLGLAVLLGGVAFSYLVGRSIGAAVDRLAARARELAEGQFEGDPLPEEGQGELVDLARAFNVMLEALREREALLQAERVGLEDQVEARTRELRAETLRLENANRLLEVQNEQVEAADRAKTEFLATISHELRTPLNSVIGFSDLLLREDEKTLTTTQREDIETIHTAAQHLLSLINDLLDLSKVEAGKLEVRPTRVAPGELIQKLEALAQGLPANPGVTLAFECDPAAPDAWADEKRLRQVVTNLISNALKFTASGRVRTSASEDAAGRLVIEVEDTGPGIAEEARSRIFEPFAQADQGIGREHAGTGLGLTISQRLVELMGGEVEVDSTLGEGSTFRVRLPAAREDGEAPERRNRARESGSVQG